MNWTLPKYRLLDSYGEDINIHAKGLVRPRKCQGYKRLGLVKKKPKLTLVVNNSKKR